MRIIKKLLPLLLVAFAQTSTPALAAKSEPNWPAIDREAIELFLNYLRIDTTNPPGNEIRAARFFASICAAEGIEHRVFESSPGRGTLWARIPGDGTRRPLVLLNHTDVVPHSREFWSVDAFAAVEKDGFIFGRGAMDMKSLGIAQFLTFLTLKRTGVSLKRDIIFLATADEEAGGREGAGWFARSHAELLGKAEFLLNEGGGNVVDDRGIIKSIGVGPSEKTPVWLRLIAKGVSGHASIPIADSSVNRLLRALDRLLNYTPPIQVTPVVEEAFRARSVFENEPLRSKFSNIREAVKDKDLVALLESDPRTVGLLRNTISITMLEGSNKVNVIPPVAHADIDTRIVPGEKIERWIGELKRVIRDDGIEIETLLAFEANASSTSSEMVRAIAAVAERKHPDATISFPVLLGFTDCHYFRDLGIESYGFTPFLGSPQNLGGGYHGNDERIARVAFLAGVRLYFEVVAEVSR
ncbi:MAG: M20/M25/M40 family metallo-hydrolase [Acidobacteriota bacterium]